MKFNLYYFDSNSSVCRFPESKSTDRSEHGKQDYREVILLHS